MTGIQGYNKCASCGRFIRLWLKPYQSKYDIGCDHCEDWLA